MTSTKSSKPENNSDQNHEDLEATQKEKPIKKIKKSFEYGAKVGKKGLETGVEIVGKSAEVASKGVQVAGKGVQIVGKGVQYTGKGVEYAGREVEAVGQYTEQKTEEGVKTVVHFVKKRRSIRDYFWKSKGGVITGCADNDPAGIVTYTQLGAITGFRFLWLCLIAWPLLTVVEEMSARIGVVTKKGINNIIIENFHDFWAYLAALIVLVCNTFTIGADIAAMSDVASILTKIPEIVFVIILGALFFYLLWKKGYRAISNYLFILTPFFLLYVASAFLLPVPWGTALKDLVVPNFHSFSISTSMIIVAFLGTTISPYLVFWETTQEIEENKSVKKLHDEATGVASGMFFSQFISFFIIVAAAAAFAGQNHVITSAKEAALALKPMGNVSFLLFSLGILGSGLLGIPVLAASTGYTFSETFHWQRGLDKKVSEAKGFYVVMIMSLVIGIIIALFGFNPILMLIYSQVLNGILMPILILLLLFITNNKKIMGQYTNKIFTNVVAILAFLACLGFDIAMLIDWLKK